MFNIIPSLCIILGLAGLIYIFQYRQNKGNKIKEEQEFEKVKEKKKKLLESFSKIINKENYHKIGNSIYSFTEKVLVRSRIIILRVDRAIFTNLTKIRIKKNIPNPGDIKSIIDSFPEEACLELDIENKNKLSTSQEEKKLLKKVSLNPDDLAAFKNLARIYLWRQDFVSACWALLQAYRLNKEDNVVQDLLIELYEKRGGKRE